MSDEILKPSQRALKIGEWARVSAAAYLEIYLLRFDLELNTDGLIDRQSREILYSFDGRNFYAVMDYAMDELERRIRSGMTARKSTR